MNDRSAMIRDMLEEAFAPVSLHIEDESWKHADHAGAKEQGGGHFHIHIVAAQFSGCSRIQRHRMVNQALATLFGPSIHALSIKALAPGES